MSKVTKPRRLRPNRIDINPDGVRIVVDWVGLKPGMSIFIPACNTKEAIAQVYDVTANWKWQLKHAIRVENNKLGVRFWRYM